METCYSLPPEDLLVEILSWLPVKSLLRFRCVCKSWLLLFANPYFINKHLNYSNKTINHDQHRRLLVGHRRGKTESFSSLSYQTLDVVYEDLGFRRPSNEDLGFRRPSNELRLLGSFNGVVCLADENSQDIMFWNPATRQMKLVHKSSFPAPPGAMHCRTEHGLGYDFKTNDYKVLKIVTTISRCPRALRRAHRTELYSLRTDSWKKIDNVIPQDFRVERYTHLRACVNGIYSRLVYSYDGKEYSYYVLTFDMSDELSFLTPQVPNATGYKVEVQEDMALMPLNDSVAYIWCQHGPKENEKLFEIYVLTEYGPSGTWSKLYTIGPLPNIRSPLLFWNNDEFFFENGNGELVLCDSTTSKINIIKTGGTGNSLQLLEYNESLVSFG